MLALYIALDPWRLNYITPQELDFSLGGMIKEVTKTKIERQFSSRISKLVESRINDFAGLAHMFNWHDKSGRICLVDYLACLMLAMMVQRLLLDQDNVVFDTWPSGRQEVPNTITTHIRSVNRSVTVVRQEACA